MMTEKKCLVIGYGSIGQRHVSVLNELGHHTAVVSRRIINYQPSYQSVQEAVLYEKPEYIVIANETVEHEKTLSLLMQLGYSGKILVEKPLFANLSDNKGIPKNTYVGYNLRFHPIIQKLQEELSSEQVLSVQSYVGQYLPSWRPDSEYRDSYSARKDRGGGVLRDLSHELDYLYLLFGQWKCLSAQGGTYSKLEIDSDDHFTILYQTPTVPTITVQMNYIDHIGQRFIVVNTNTSTYHADLINNTLKINNKTFQYTVERNDTYRSQHIAILTDELANVCTFKEGFNLMEMIKSAETASTAKVWVYNE